MDPPPGPKKYPGSTISEQGITSLFCFHLPIIFSRKRRLFKQPTNPSVTSLNKYKGKNSINEFMAYHFDLFIKCNVLFWGAINITCKLFRTTPISRVSDKRFPRKNLGCTSIDFVWPAAWSSPSRLPSILSAPFLECNHKFIWCSSEEMSQKTIYFLIEIRYPAYPKQ